MSDRQRVLVTGASGEIASQILPELGQGHEVVPVDVRSTDRQGRPVQGVQLADLTDPDRSRYQRHFEDVDVVVHGDALLESNENLFVVIDNAAGANLGNSVAELTIKNDDRIVLPIPPIVP